MSRISSSNFVSLERAISCRLPAKNIYYNIVGQVKDSGVVTRLTKYDWENCAQNVEANDENLRSGEIWLRWPIGCLAMQGDVTSGHSKAASAAGCGPPI